MYTGDNWDHVAYDPDNKLVLAVVLGKRSPENISKVVEEAKKRTGGRLMDMITTDEYKGYKPAILKHYGEAEELEPNKLGRPRKPKMLPFIHDTPQKFAKLFRESDRFGIL